MSLTGRSANTEAARALRAPTGPLLVEPEASWTVRVELVMGIGS